MRHIRLGRTGLPVSRLCLGTMTFGLQCDEPASAAIMDRAAAGGITFFDTADVYPVGGGLETVGRTEEIVGRWLAPRRHDIVIATKCSGAMSGRPQDRCWHEREFATVDALRPFAQEAGLSLAGLAVAWTLAHPAITSAIIGASRPEQLDDLLVAVEKPISADLKARLDELTLEYRWGDDPR